MFGFKRIKEAVISLTPWREINDRRRQFNGTYIGPERRDKNQMSQVEVRAALNEQFDALSTTIIKARQSAGDK